MENPDTYEPVELTHVIEDDELLNHLTDYDGPDLFISALSELVRAYRNGT